jgi:uncharacterized beta-barrel protein YwiB (DUF1934 family)
MSLKRNVEVRIESNSPDQSMIQSVSGDLYLKGEAVYIRYLEPDPTMGDTNTTVKIKGDEVKVIRHGGLNSEQTFSTESIQWGFYQTAQGSLELETRTKTIDIQLEQGIGTVSWSYDLYVSEDYAGKFELKLDIQEAQK